jgi:5-(carboxyamino)imidazole ribonucleotide synthase
VSALPPGSAIGVLGGGQLGRMLALAAIPMGYRVHVLDPSADCAARPVAERCVTAAFESVAGATDLARGVDVVTIEIEKIGADALAAAARHAPLRPSAQVLLTVQDRARQKTWLQAAGFPVGPFRVAGSAGELAAALTDLAAPCLVKAAQGGYDGRGQVEAVAAEGDRAWSELAASAVTVELALALDAELSVLVARRPAGQVAVFPPALNHHADGILVWSVLPAPLPESVLREARELGAAIAAALQVEGLLAVELFLVDGRLLVNELAPRPHNSFHATLDNGATSQFEQAVRAICDLPLGEVEPARPAAIHNLLGDLWSSGEQPDFAAALAVEGVRLHIYDKGQPRPGRKMGHLAATGTTANDALTRAGEAYRRLRG